MHLYQPLKTRHAGSPCVWRGPGLSPRILLFASFAVFVSTFTVSAQPQAPELLTYNELIQLYEQATPPDALQKKMHALLTTPFVSNAASARGVKPLLPSSPALGKFVRVIEWNIERGLEYDAIRAAFTDAASFGKLIDSAAYPRGSA
jgi:hypothetical protein